MNLANLFESTGSYFHGGWIDDKNRPIFFTKELWIAKEYAERAPTPDDEMIVYEATLTMRKSATIDDLHRAIEETGTTEKDVPGDLDEIDDTDFILAPKVIEFLKREGFDSFIGEGTFDTISIEEYIVFSWNQVKVIKTHKVE